MVIFGYSIKFCFTSYPICPKTLDNNVQSVGVLHSLLFFLLLHSLDSF